MSFPLILGSLKDIIRKPDHFALFLFLAAAGFCFSQTVADSSQSDMDLFVGHLLSEMTVEEKIGQLNQAVGGRSFALNSKIDDKQKEDIRNGRVGSYLHVLGSDFLAGLQKIAVDESRLGIPLLFAMDVVHGFRTVFPVPIACASMWETNSMEQIARISAIEASASGVHWTFAPMIDIARDPRWGRIVEGTGEDPYLGAVLAAAQVRGYQGGSLDDPTTILACPKHFVAYGAAIGGRDYNSVDISQRSLREVYLPPFLSAFQAGAASVMSGFHDLNGIPMTANRGLCTDLLRGEWGFDGLMISDWNSVLELVKHGIVLDGRGAAFQALTAGVDMDMASGIYSLHLKSLVEAGSIPESTLNQAVRRILNIKYRLGLFEDPYRYCDAERERAEVLAPAHVAFARQAARKAIVLLKNDKNLLPLDPYLRKIAVIGPLADDARSPLGSWRAAGRSTDVITVLQGIQRAVSPKTEVEFLKGCEIDSPNKAGFEKAERLAIQSDAVVLVLGEDHEMSGEAKSRSEIELPGVQLELAQKIIATGTPTVVVLMNGRPLAIPWLAEYAPAILETWFLGIQAGPALADVLFDKANPGGKLPVTIPRSTGQIPQTYHHRNTGRPANEDKTIDSARYFDLPITPLFPFGHGLSYTEFEYDNLEIQVDTTARTTTIRFSLQNSGKRQGDEVVQLYVRDRFASVARPVKELKGFDRIPLYPRQKKTLTWTLDWKQLSFYNRDLIPVVEPGDFDIFIGSSSEDIRLSGQFEITGQVRQCRTDQIHFSKLHVR